MNQRRWTHHKSRHLEAELRRLSQLLYIQGALRSELGSSLKLACQLLALQKMLPPSIFTSHHTQCYQGHILPQRIPQNVMPIGPGEPRTSVSLVRTQAISPLDYSVLGINNLELFSRSANSKKPASGVWTLGESSVVVLSPATTISGCRGGSLLIMWVSFGML